MWIMNLLFQEADEEDSDGDEEEEVTKIKFPISCPSIIFPLVQYTNHANDTHSIKLTCYICSW